MATTAASSGYSTTGADPQSTGMPFRLSDGSSYKKAQEAHSLASSTAAAAMPHDGRKASEGQVSGVQAWKPQMNRQQSWNQEDLKRERLKKELEMQGGEGYTETKSG
ncbi:hypothetical protein BP6252_04196 [Coleophoma cylindrospora]|uniref:Uncharacterized protein n=1 Tax=Coleophoma cylindrospora TaxID=1849047 RepID=A0A3D8RZV9_9HELO|nr:hypothetical protein BP6252_04196 [Coleophoma cylindrospora]